MELHLFKTPAHKFKQTLLMCVFWCVIDNIPMKDFSHTHNDSHALYFRVFENTIMIFTSIMIYIRYISIDYSCEKSAINWLLHYEGNHNAQIMAFAFLLTSIEVIS